MFHDGHEQRLQRVEASQQAMTGQLATVAGDIKGLGAALESNTALIMAQIDAAVKPLASQLHSHIAADGLVAARVNVMEEAVSVHRDRLDDLDGHHTKRVERWKAFKDWFKVILTGASAIGVKELVVYIAHHI